MNAEDSLKLARRFIGLPLEKRQMFLAALHKEGVDFARFPIPAGVDPVVPPVRAATSGEVKDLRREATALKEVVADLTLENRLLKKSMSGDGEDEA